MKLSLITALALEPQIISFVVVVFKVLNLKLKSIKTYFAVTFALHPTNDVRDYHIPVQLKTDDTNGLMIGY